MGLRYESVVLLCGISGSFFEGFCQLFMRVEDVFDGIVAIG